MRKFILWFAIIIFINFICGRFFYDTKDIVEDEAIYIAQTSSENNIIEKKLNSMSLDEKIGQMVIIGVHGSEMNDDIKNMLTQYNIGGIIFYNRNMENKIQVKNFIEDLQNNANEKNPLFIAVDQEGGRVSRMQNDLTVYPSQTEICAGGNPVDAKNYAKAIAQDLKELGFNINFAPVADVGSNNSRFFSDDPYIAAEFVSNAAKGYEDTKLFYCLKHFPGIGRGKVDSHKDVSIIDGDINFLINHDLPPFVKVINEQDNSKFMIMVSHLKYEALDTANSASLSSVVMTDLLRNKLGFKGVIITDDLEMGATSNYNDFDNVGVQAVEAGADIVLVCHEYDHEIKVYLSILNAVNKGTISEERINESVRRILKMKTQL